jgi:hypothetical protein
VGKALADYERVLHRTLGPMDGLPKAIEDAFHTPSHRAIDQAIQDAQGAWTRQMDPVRSAIDSFQASLSAALGVDQTDLTRFAESLAPAIATPSNFEHLMRLATDIAELERMFSELPTFDRIEFEDSAVVVDKETIEIADAVAALDADADGPSLMERLEAMK